MSGQANSDLRNMFATAAMEGMVQAIVYDCSPLLMASLAKKSFQVADAMLEEMERSKLERVSNEQLETVYKEPADL